MDERTYIPGRNTSKILQMKKIAILAALLGLAACAQPQDEQNLPENVMVTGTNPIISNQFAADPTARVFNGKIYTIGHVEHAQGRVVKITSAPDMPLETDGELHGGTPVTITVVPQAIKIVVTKEFAQ